MSAVSPGPEEACPGSVRPPLLCTLLQAAHQVDWRSWDHPQPCEMQKNTLPLLASNAYPPSGHASAHPAFLSQLVSGDYFVALNADSSLTWLDSKNSLNDKDLAALTPCQRCPCFSFFTCRSLSLSLVIHRQCIINKPVDHCRVFNGAIIKHPPKIQYWNYFLWFHQKHNHVNHPCMTCMHWTVHPACMTQQQKPLGISEMSNTWLKAHKWLSGVHPGLCSLFLSEGL